MALARNLLLVLVSKTSAEELREQYAGLEFPDEVHQFAAHYNLFGILSREASQKAYISPFLRHLANDHRDEAIRASNLLPGPLGSRAIDRLKEGDIEGCLEDLQEEIRRSETIVRVSPQFLSEDDQLQLFIYLSICGTALGRLGNFEQGKLYLQKALDAFAQLGPDMQAKQAEQAQQIPISIAWYLQLEFRFPEALAVVDGALNDFSFSSYPTAARESLVNMQRMLTDFAPLVADYVADAGTAGFYAELLRKIQRCSTAEDARRMRAEVVRELKDRAALLNLRKLCDLSVAALQKRTDLVRKLIDDGEPVGSPAGLLTEAQICLMFTDEETRDRLRNEQAAVVKMYELMGTLQEASRGSLQAMLEKSIAVNQYSLAEISALKEGVYKVPMRMTLRWLWLTLSRFIIQIALICYLLEEVGGQFLEDKGKGILEGTVFRHKEFWIKAAVILLMYFVGNALEHSIDRRQLRKYKHTLMLLVMDRGWQLWVSLNALTQFYSQAEVSLRNVER